jgi:hypothetical protein
VYLLKEIVGEADIEWGRTLGEQPYFEKAGCPAHPDDPYTFASVRNTLSGLLKELAQDKGKDLQNSNVSGVAT